MTAAAATRVLALLQGARRPAAFSAAAAATAARPAAALRSVGSGRLAPLAQRLGALHGAAVVCSASAGDGLLEVTLKVDGMVCEGCSGRVEETLQKMAGVKRVHVDLEKGLATVGVEAGMEEKIGAAAKTLAEAVRELGFDAEPQLAA